VCRGDTVQIIARWQRSVALTEALVVLYWEMRSKSHRRIRMVIEMASEPIVFFHHQLEIKVI
jgi:hypothetical protein